VFYSIFIQLSPFDRLALIVALFCSALGKFLQTRKAWHKSQRLYPLWNHLIYFRPWEIAPAYVARMATLHVFESKKALLIHLVKMERKLWEERKVERHENRKSQYAALYNEPPPMLPTGLFPMMTFDPTHRLLDLTFVTRLHVLGMLHL
jgi:hypothetical protein